MSRPAGRRTLILAALLGASAVAIGAFGAHALDGRLSERALGWYRTGAAYHATHALALLGCGLFAAHAGSWRQAGDVADAPGSLLRVAASCLGVGTLLFCGSLYLMAFTGWTRLGIVTPLGGLALIAGWLAMAIAAWRLRAP